MAGLNLIQEYSSDSDEEVEYSNDENKALFNVENVNTKLPLPQSILSWKGVQHHEEKVDDPSEHEGRVRSFKHERGNWATLIYIDYVPNEEMLQWMNKVLVKFMNTGKLFEEFHISLTRTLILKFHWIDSFVEAVKTITSGHQHFVVELANFKVFRNEEKTRTFLGITTQSTSNSLQSFTQAFDKLANEYQLPTFYKDASYHISIFWCLGDQRKTLEAILPSITSSFYDLLAENPELRYVQVNSLKCKIGNKLFNFNLQ